jgi:hypothetical protein
MEDHAFGTTSLFTDAVQLLLRFSVAGDVAKPLRAVPLKELVYFQAHGVFLLAGGLQGGE